jgi:hypothetical protein
VDAAKDRLLNRRSFGRIALAAVAAGVALIRGGVAFAFPAGRGSLRTVYVFDPTAEVASGHTGCATCTACRRHAEHKRFASRELADARRAHPHCRCAIREVTVPAAQYGRMFDVARGVARRGEFDVRW